MAQLSGTGQPICAQAKVSALARLPVEERVRSMVNDFVMLEISAVLARLDEVQIVPH